MFRDLTPQEQRTVLHLEQEVEEFEENRTLALQAVNELGHQDDGMGILLLANAQSIYRVVRKKHYPLLNS